MDTFSVIDAMPDASSVNASTALQERRFHVLKSDDVFAIVDSIGDMTAAPGSNDGLYFRDTRHVSGLNLLVGGARPLLLNSSLSADNLMLTANLTNAGIRDAAGEVVEQGLIYIRRSIFLLGGALFSRMALSNHGMQPFEIRVQLGFDADFADLFEVRGMHRPHRGTRRATIVEPAAIQADYLGLDAIARRTLLRFDPAPNQLTPGSAGFSVRLLPGKPVMIFQQIDCAPQPTDQPCAGRNFGVSLLQAHRAMRVSAARTASIAAEDGAFDDTIRRAASDLRMLTTSKPTGPYPYAGIPWFSTAFGRDALITAMLVLWQDPSLARGVLGYLAQEQATDYDPASDAEPGKILHEMRGGEMASLNEIPFGLYYGSIDSTPLFIVLAGLYLERTGDLATVRELWPAIERGFAWMDGPGDRDVDGFLEYARADEKGLQNQGWKDSQDAVFHSDGRLAEGAIALVEVQGYAYAARHHGARMAAALGDAARSAALAAQAEAMRDRFDAAFWCEEIGMYAIALDGEKRPCRVRTSNAAHVLWTGIARPERAARIAAEIVTPKFLSGWGVRTVAEGEPRYNPMSYHNGSIWPHDNSLIVWGLARYGLMAEAERIFEALFAASNYFDSRRLPELFCGFRRRRGAAPTLYPVACAPQAWAAAAPFLLLQSCLGLEFDPATRAIRFRNPRLPSFADEITLRDLGFADARVDVTLRQVGDHAAVRVLRNTGAVQVSMLLD